MLHFRHLFHVVSNIRPLVWMCVYVVAIPVFAMVYYALPDGQFRIPDGGGTDFGSWLYYSIVTISTLGFGDYTPSGWMAQLVTACEVMCGVLTLGFFLNAVGSMKSEIDVESELEKQKRVHQAAEKDKLLQMAGPALRILHAFVNHCQEVTKATDKQVREDAVATLMRSSGRTAIALDSLQTRIDLTIWPDLLEYCFAFVANYQILSVVDGPNALRLKDNGDISDEMKNYITENSKLAQNIELLLTRVGSAYDTDTDM